MEPPDLALWEARLARETADKALSRYRAAVEQVADIGHRLRLSSYAIRVSLDLLHEIESHGPGFSLQREPAPAVKVVLDAEILAKLSRLIEMG